MRSNIKVASYGPKGQGEKAMKQQKAILIALIVICITVIMTVLVTRSGLCAVRFRNGRTEVAVFTVYEPVK